MYTFELLAAISSACGTSTMTRSSEQLVNMHCGGGGGGQPPDVRTGLEGEDSRVGCPEAPAAVPLDSSRHHMAVEGCCSCLCQSHHLLRVASPRASYTSPPRECSQWSRLVAVAVSAVTKGRLLWRGATSSPPPSPGHSWADRSHRRAYRRSRRRARDRLAVPHG